MTETLRELEIAHRADPTDERARLRFYDETARRHDLALTRDPGVYVHASGVQLVYVPGGEVECYRRERLDGYSMRRNLCPICKDTGKAPLAPFYLGRFPVTWREFLTFRVASLDPNPPRRPTTSEIKLRDMSADELNRPVTGISLEDARAFCSWAGLRLPSEQEWRWAALGGSIPSLDAQSPAPWKIGSMHVRRLPWGNEPTGTSTMAPARPNGASWCGAHDMAGNVFEIVDSGLALGGSFRSEDMTGWPRNTGPVREARDDVGFRVALSARTA